MGVCAMIAKVIAEGSPVFTEQRHPGYLCNPDYPNYQAWGSEVKKFFGLKPTQKWPAEGMPKRIIQGITCWVLPGPAPSKVKSSQHRTMACCPNCGKVTPIGRLKQHAKGCRPFT